MYKTIAKRRAHGLFASIGEGDHDALLRDVADDVHHIFPGDHALGGERHSREAMRRWFRRLDQLFPEIHFEVKRVAVKGWPWDMMIAVEWADRGLAADGEPYENEGAHWIRIKRGRGTYVHAYLDTEKVSRACERMAAAGIEEASAAPITDGDPTQPDA
jgi:ketosteroid isomerase-like protein